MKKCWPLALLSFLCGCGGSAAPPPPPPPPPPPGPIYSNHPMGHIKAARPLISKGFESAMDPNQLKIEVDGKDVTPRARRQSGSVSYQPEADLSPGNHTVRVYGRTLNNKITGDSWTFVIDPR